uniref:DYW_deaminase domain-containing protein n=1 Tax=Gongylonema pulchrum TaxID=637853 RepID=A0A183DC62_9BILA
LLKCLRALEKKGYLHIFETVVVEEFRSNKILVVTESDIADASHPDIEAAIRATINEYNEKGRVFPHGQLRFVCTCILFTYGRKKFKGSSY